MPAFILPHRIILTFNKTLRYFINNISLGFSGHLNSLAEGIRRNIKIAGEIFRLGRHIREKTAAFGRYVT